MIKVRARVAAFEAFVFQGGKTAAKAFATLEDHMLVYPWIDDAAVVSRSKREDPRLEEFAASLTKDTSALVLVGEKITLAEFTSAVEPFGEGDRDQPRRKGRQEPEGGPQEGLALNPSPTAEH